MATVASFSYENGQNNRLTAPENLYIPGFKIILKKN